MPRGQRFHHAQVAAPLAIAPDGTRYFSLSNKSTPAVLPGIRPVEAPLMECRKSNPAIASPMRIPGDGLRQPNHSSAAALTELRKNVMSVMHAKSTFHSYSGIFFRTVTHPSEIHICELSSHFVARSKAACAHVTENPWPPWQRIE